MWRLVKDPNTLNNMFVVSWHAGWDDCVVLPDHFTLGEQWMALELPIKQQDGAVKRISHSERTCSKVVSNVRLINSCLFEGGDYQKNDQLHTGMVPPNAGSIGVDFDSTGTYTHIYIYRWNYSNSISLFFFRNLLVGSRLANCAWKRRSSTWFNVPLKLSISDADVLKSTHETLMLPFYRSRTWSQSQDASCPMEMLFGP